MLARGLLLAALVALVPQTLACSEAHESVADAGAQPDAGAPMVDVGTPHVPDGGEPLEPVDPGFSYTPPESADGGTDGGVDIGGEQVTLLVVFDKSGSMGSPWVTDPESEEHETRWTAASAAMLDAIWPHKDRVTVGALLFPQLYTCTTPGIEDDSQIDFVGAETFIDQWIASAPDNGPTGSTPMEAAFVSADAALDRAEALGLLEHRLEVLVLTDGEPNCGTYVAELERFAAEWLERGIRTNVMGLPGTTGAEEVLDRIAAAGGTEEHTTIGSPGELEDAVGALL